MTKRRLIWTAAVGLLLAGFLYAGGADFQLVTIRGRKVLVHPDALTVPVEDASREGGQLIASTAKSLLEMSDRAISVREFGAVGDGSTDDTTAINDAYTYAAANNLRLYFPKGTYKLTSTLTIATDKLCMYGDGQLATIIAFYGSGPAITVTSEGNRFEHFKLLAISPAAHSATHGLNLTHTSASTGTGFQYLVRDVHIQGFNATTSCVGLRCTNIEHSLFEQILVYGCGIGFYADCSTQLSGAKGINNRWVECRAQENSGDGWEIKDQTCGIFDNCQSFKNGAPNAQFWLRTGNSSCKIRNLDVEQWGSGSDHPELFQTTIGALIVGAKHEISVNAVALNVPLRFATATKCVIRASNFSSNASGIVLDSASNDNEIDYFGDSITDQGARNNFSRGNVQTKATDYTMLTSDRMVLGNGTVTITLADPAKVVIGQPYTVKNIHASGVCTVAGTIDGTTNYSLASQNKFVTVVSNGTSWYVVGAN